MPTKTTLLECDHFARFVGGKLLPAVECFTKHVPVSKPVSILWSGSAKQHTLMHGLQNRRHSLRVIQAFRTPQQIGDLNAALQENTPIKWNHYSSSIEHEFGLKKVKMPTADQYRLFGKVVWKLTPAERTLSEEDLRLLFLEAIDRDREKFERLKRKFSGTAGERVLPKREVISENVRILVWRRDEGKCVQCGSQERLEYDHLIPVCKGGSNTARNIQLLCEQCNRKKRDSI